LAVSRNIHTSIDPLGVIEKDDEDEQNKDATDCTANGRNSCKPISYFLDSTDTISANSNGKNPDGKITIPNENDGNNGGTGTSLFVPQKVLKSNASWCFDIVTPSDRRSACFTHSYGRFIRGTGSVLFLGSDRGITGDDSNDDGVKPSSVTEGTVEEVETAVASRTSYNATKRLKTTTSSTPPSPTTSKITSSTDSNTTVDRFKLVPAHQRTFDRNWAEGVNIQDTFRYFSGEEMARLMGFPVAVVLNDDDVVAEPPRGRRRVDEGNEKCKHEGGDDSLEDWMMGDGVKTFRFPPDMTVRQKWKLLGNSLNVTVAAKIVEVALRLSLHSLTVTR